MMRNMLLFGCAVTAGFASAAGAEPSFIYQAEGYGGYHAPYMTLVSIGAGVATEQERRVTEEVYAVYDMDLNITAQSPSTTVSCIATDSLLRMEASWIGEGYAGYSQISNRVFFTVDEDAYLDVSWDLTGVLDVDASPHAVPYSGQGPGYIFVASQTTQDLLDSSLFDMTVWSQQNPTGSVRLRLEAGGEYVIWLYQNNDLLFDTSPNYMQASLSAVPAPGVASMLGVGFMIVGRRRRG